MNEILQYSFDNSQFNIINESIYYFRKNYLDKYFSDINCWIAGGSLRDYVSGNKNFSDVDIYFPTVEEYDKAFEKLSKNYRFNLKYLNNNACRLYVRSIEGDENLDLVKIYENNPEETIKKFDFTVCCAAVDRHNFYCHQNFFVDLCSKRLNLFNPTKKFSLLGRLQKYYSKGFKANNKVLLEIAKIIREIELPNFYNIQDMDKEISSMQF